MWFLTLACLTVWAACGGDGGTTPTGDTPSGTANGIETPADAVDGTPEATPSGELSVTFIAACDEGDGAPEMSVGVQASATDEAFIDRVRVFIDGTQAIEKEADSVQELEEALSFSSTPGDHEVRVSVDGGGLQAVTLPTDAQQVTCPGQPEEGE